MQHIFSKLVVLVLLLLTGCASLPSEHQPPPAGTMASSPRLPAELGMNRDAGHGNVIFVNVQMENGSAWPFVIDTGTTWTVFDKSLEPLLGQRVHTATVWRWGVQEDSGIYPAPKLFLGGAPLLTGRAVATDDFQKISRSFGRSVMGLIGMDTLKNYCMQLDFAAGKVRFLDPDHADKSKWGQAFPLTDIGDGCLRVNENLAGADGPGSLIDTGCAYDGWLTWTVYQQWTNRTVLPAAGEVRRPEGVLGGEHFSHLALRGLDLSALTDGDRHMKFNGLGLSFLSRRVVTFDFPNHTMYLKHPSVRSLIF
jgi:hypothetical protein